MKNSFNQQKEDKERFTIDEIDNSTIIIDKKRNAIHIFEDRVCESLDELMELFYEAGRDDGRRK